VVQPPRVGEVHPVDAGDALDGDLVHAHRLPKAEHGQNSDLVAGVEALHVLGGVGLGVTRALRLRQCLGKRAPAPLHFRQDVVRGPVQDAEHSAEMFASQTLTDGVQQRGAACHTGFDPQVDACRPRPLHKLHAVLRHKLLVGGHEVLSVVQCRQSNGAGGSGLAHQLHDDVHVWIPDHSLPVPRDSHRLAQPGEIFFVNVSRADGLELEPTTEPPLHFARVLRQHLDGPGAHGSHANDAKADRRARRLGGNAGALGRSCLDLAHGCLHAGCEAPAKPRRLCRSDLPFDFAHGPELVEGRKGSESVKKSRLC